MRNSFVDLHYNKKHTLILNKQNIKIMTNTFNQLSKENKVTFAAQFVIMDAIEKGHTDMSEMMEYMKTEIFRNAVFSYMDLMEAA